MLGVGLQVKVKDRPADVKKVHPQSEFVDPIEGVHDPIGLAGPRTEDGKTIR